AAMQALATTPSFGAEPPAVGVYKRIDQIYRSLADTTEQTAAVIASLFDGLLAAVGQWLTSVIAVGWRTSLLLGGDILAITVFDLALLADNPIPADSTVQLEVTVTGRQSAEGTRLWDRRGRANTRFHHYFDQLLHVDLAGDDRPLDLSFAVLLDGAALPSLFAEAPAAVDESTHVFQSAQLRDSTGAVVGTIRFDTRRLGRDAAAQELLTSGLWTPELAQAYANALGKAMVDPILSRLRAIPPRLVLGGRGSGRAQPE
ncbi:MAG: hypothetical protein JO144_03075, partial [Actinobacteria bacterium]|nr:hypothetical protein [Actinomycetota bacterium]